MNLTRRALFASLTAPVITRADSFKNLFKTEYVFTTRTSHSCLHTGNDVVLRLWLKTYGDTIYNMFHNRSLLHKDYDNIDCIAASAYDPTKQLKATLSKQTEDTLFDNDSLKLYYTLRLLDTSYKDPDGIYDLYLPKAIYVKYLGLESTEKPVSIFV